MGAPSPVASAPVDVSPLDSSPPEDGDAVVDRSSGRSLLQSSAIVAIGTATSRVTGLLRTVTQAAVLGAAALSDAYNVANTAPNLLYDLLAGGVLAATIVPAFVDARHRRDREATSAIVSVLGVAMLAVTAVSMLAAPFIASRFSDTEAERALTLSLLLCFLPQIFFYGITTILSGILNAHRRFAAAALVPVVNNVVAIAVLVAFAARMPSDPSVAQVNADAASTLLLGLGTTAGIVAMALLLTPAVASLGLGLRWRFDVHHPAVRRVLRLSGWTFGYVATNQVALWVIFFLADGSGPGANDGSLTHYLYAYQFFQLPYGILAASVITAFLPELAERVKAGDHAGFADRFMLAARTSLVLVLPCTVVFLVLAHPIISVLLEYRSFDADASDATAEVLAAFAIGLPGFCLYLLAMRGFYAHDNTKVPFLINVGQTLVQLGLCIWLVADHGAAGLALGFALAYVIGAGAALYWLSALTGGLPWHENVVPLGRLAVATAAMAVVVVVLGRVLGSDDGLGAWVRLVAAGGAGVAAFVGAGMALGIPELRRVGGLLRR